MRYIIGLDKLDERERFHVTTNAPAGNLAEGERVIGIRTHINDSLCNHGALTSPVIEQPLTVAPNSPKRRPSA